MAADADAVIRFRAPEGAGIPEGLGFGEREDGLMEARTTDLTRDLHTLTSWALDEGVVLEDLTVRRLSLEDVFLRLTDDDDEDEGEEAT